MVNIRTSSCIYLLAVATLISTGCSKKDGATPTPVPVTTPLTVKAAFLNTTTVNNGNTYYNIGVLPAIKYSFSAPVNRSSVNAGIVVRDMNGATITYNASYSNLDSVVTIQPSAPLQYISRYTVTAASVLKSAQGNSLVSSYRVDYVTSIDSSDKFPRISDDELLTKIQQQTFKYFWDYGHPVSGLARERSNGGENTVTSGGSGFGMMSIPVAINRNFITRQEGLQRLQTMVSFLKNTAQKFHGAFPHWLDGSTGAVIPFSTKDNGADLVETSFLSAGLMTVRQFFSGTNAAEVTLRADINSILDGIEWNWFRKGNEQQLYWHWSPVYNWDINLAIRGWNECLVTYIMAKSSATYAISDTVYNNGWKGANSFTNGTSYYGYPLPLGPSQGGPLFFSHYSFLGINPNGLTDASANYAVQTKNHTLINRAYCIENPQKMFGYSPDCWGLTASDIPNGYTASSPTNDVGVISPTAALSSFPYTPAESMQALKFFYYKLGDKLWKDYGFVDAFSLKETWFANSHLAIDQGPIVVMIENYRTGLLWNLFTSSPEIKASMRSLGFTAPYL